MDNINSTAALRSVSAIKRPRPLLSIQAASLAHLQAIPASYYRYLISSISLI